MIETNVFANALASSFWLAVDSIVGSNHFHMLVRNIIGPVFGKKLEIVWAIFAWDDSWG